MKRRDKQVSAQLGTLKGRKPFKRSTSVLPDAETSPERICWRFCHVDHDGPWGFGKMDATTLRELLDKLMQFESMKVNEVFSNGEEPGKHYEVDRIPNAAARERLEELRLSDMTKISRLRLGGKVRLYGFMEGNCFHVVWWDPEHQIWPSVKRNT
ncbi:hypothetical protein [Sphaerisporangium sp. TRM90804]|uniref:hypothetical protein n=1 Tax=Sphaerisporangium sp. TRM90804 TaxID=3031113 RepID=UPI00244CB0DF|nr:hypothetical protein [Sphaerisporangium sp. TRM90804]MDH2424707.1 hypothetical protein [Sphaerisporangium sp. TRM90804]